MKPSEVLVVMIPGHPPSVNRMYATVRGRRVKSREARLWEAHCLGFVVKALRAKERGWVHKLPLGGIEAEYLFERPDWVAKNGNIKTPDADSGIKAVQDSVFNALGLNDKNVITIISRKVIGQEVRTIVKLKFIGEDWIKSCEYYFFA